MKIIIIKQILAIDETTAIWLIQGLTKKIQSIITDIIN